MVVVLVNKVAVLNITNKEKEDCKIWIVDYSGNIYYKTDLKPDESFEFDIRKLVFGIYRMVFKTKHTSFIQEFVKY